MNDPIVEEIHAIRENIYEECGGDSEKLAEYCLNLQKDSLKNRQSANEEIQRNKTQKPLDQ